MAQAEPRAYKLELVMDRDAQTITVELRIYDAVGVQLLGLADTWHTWLLDWRDVATWVERAWRVAGGDGAQMPSPSPMVDLT